MFNIENRAVYDRMWKNIIQNRPQVTIWCRRIARWIPTATNTHSEYAIHITFPLQHWLNERAPLFRYTCSAYLVKSNVITSLSQLVAVCVHYYKLTAVTRHNNRPTYTYRVFTFYFYYRNMK